MAMELPGAVGGTGREALTLIVLLLEMIALRHQIAVLKRSGAGRPCFRLRDRLFWLLLARWWPVGPVALSLARSLAGWTVENRSRLRQLIVRMARENCLWGAPRIHGELLRLGFAVSQATVSRSMPPANRRRGRSWRTFIRNEALAIRRDERRRMTLSGTVQGCRDRSHFPQGRPVSFAAGQHEARRPLAVSHRLGRVISDMKSGSHSGAQSLCLPKTISAMTCGSGYGTETVDGRVSDPAAVCSAVTVQPTCAA